MSISPEYHSPTPAHAWSKAWCVWPSAHNMHGCFTAKLSQAGLCAYVWSVMLSDEFSVSCRATSNPWYKTRHIFVCLTTDHLQNLKASLGFAIVCWAWLAVFGLCRLLQVGMQTGWTGQQGFPLVKRLMMQGSSAWSGYFCLVCWYIDIGLLFEPRLRMFCCCQVVISASQVASWALTKSS